MCMKKIILFAVPSRFLGGQIFASRCYFFVFGGPWFLSQDTFFVVVGQADMVWRHDFSILWWGNVGRHFRQGYNPWEFKCDSWRLKCFDQDRCFWPQDIFFLVLRHFSCWCEKCEILFKNHTDCPAETKKESWDQPWKWISGESDRIYFFVWKHEYGTYIHE